MRITGKEQRELDNQLQRLRMDAYLAGYPSSVRLVIDHVDEEIILMEETRQGDKLEPAIGRHAWSSAAEAIDGLRALRERHGTRSG